MGKAIPVPPVAPSGKGCPLRGLSLDPLPPAILPREHPGFQPLASGDPRQELSKSGSAVTIRGFFFCC